MCTCSKWYRFKGASSAQSTVRGIVHDNSIRHGATKAGHRQGLVARCLKSNINKGEYSMQTTSLTSVPYSLGRALTPWQGTCRKSAVLLLAGSWIATTLLALAGGSSAVSAERA